MSLSAWFAYQLKAGMDGFIWAVEQLPPAHLTETPPGALGKWNAARHVFHLLYYERQAALPHMHYWLGDRDTFPPFDASYDEDGTWEREGQYIPVVQLLQEFREVREAQIALLPRISDELWLATKTCGWGDYSLKWIVSKTFQHTADHTNSVMAMALFWELTLAWINKQKELQKELNKQQERIAEV